MNELLEATLPFRPRAWPSEHVVELWVMDLSSLPLDTGSEVSDRAAELRQQRLRQQFMLRLLLGSYLHCPGRDVELVRGQRGKPVLGEKHVDFPLQFNLSHSNHWLAIAVGIGSPLGVDIESERPMTRATALARRYFPAAEAESLARLDEPFLSRRFLQHWTAREALVKAHGCGLSGVMNRICLDGSPPAIRQLPEDWPGLPHWCLTMPRLPQGLIGHVAAQSARLVTHTFVLINAGLVR